MTLARSSSSPARTCTAVPRSVSVTLAPSRGSARGAGNGAAAARLHRSRGREEGTADDRSVSQSQPGSFCKHLGQASLARRSWRSASPQRRHGAVAGPARLVHVWQHPAPGQPWSHLHMAPPLARSSETLFGFCTLVK